MSHVYRYASYHADGWVIEMLRHYGRTIVPKDIIIGLDNNEDRIQALIEYALGDRVNLIRFGKHLVVEREI